ncbi:hypothetical protein Tco_0930296 [Tanacetum coccineum]
MNIKQDHLNSSRTSPNFDSTCCDDCVTKDGLDQRRANEAIYRLITCSIAGRSQAPEKVTVTILFYLRGMDVGSVNIPYLLARYLRRFASGRKQGAMISGGQFIALIVQDLPVIDITELAKLQICKELVDTWAWVALGLDRHPDAATGALMDTRRLAKVEDEVHKIRGAFSEQCEVMDAIARNLSRFIVWAVGGISRLLDSARATYVWYSETHVPYQRRRVRKSTRHASTSTAPLDEDQPDP